MLQVWYEWRPNEPRANTSTNCYRCTNSLSCMLSTLCLPYIEKPWGQVRSIYCTVYLWLPACMFCLSMRMVLLLFTFVNKFLYRFVVALNHVSQLRRSLKKTIHNLLLYCLSFYFYVFVDFYSFNNDFMSVCVNMSKIVCVENSNITVNVSIQM